MTSEALQQLLADVRASWRSWDQRSKIAHLVHLETLADRATALGDADLAYQFDVLCEMIAADVERAAGARQESSRQR